MLELRSDTFEDIVDEGMRNTKIAFRDKLFTLMDHGAKFSELGADLSVVFGHFIPYIQDALKDGINIHAYACRTNQEHRYVFLDEEDYTEDSKYYKRWENHKSEIEDKDTPNIYPKFSYII